MNDIKCPHRSEAFKIEESGYANNKAKALTVKKLTRGNATMKSMFDSIEKNLIKF